MLDASRRMDYANDSQPQSAEFVGVMNAQFDPALRPEAGAEALTPESPGERSSYQRSRGGDPVVTIAAIVVALGTIGTFAFMNPHFVKKQKRDATVVTLMELPDDPPPAEAPPPPPPPDAPPPPPQAQIAAPVPLVLIPPRLAIQAPAVTPPAPPSPAPAPTTPAVIAKGPENLGELSAKMISAKPPRVPMESMRAHEEGVVTLSVLLSVDGRVADISIARSSGFPRLDRAALEAVRDWRWSPLMRDGSPVMVRGMVTIPFVMQRGGRGRGPDGHGRGPGGRDRDDHHRGDGPDRGGDGPEGNVDNI